MKHTMKTALALVLALAVMLVPMSVTVFAADGSFADPYQLSASSVRFYVYVQPEETVYVQVDDCNGSTVNVGYATADTYMIQYGRQTVYPNGDPDNTASFAMNPMGDYFAVYNTGSEAISVYMSLTGGAPIDNTGTMDNPEELTLEDRFGMGFLSANSEAALDAGNEGRWYKVIAPGDGVLNIGVSAYDPETYDSVGWLYCANNVTQGKYGDNHWSDDEPVVDTEQVAVNAGDEVQIFAATYDPMNMFSNPAGTVSVFVSFSAFGSYDCPAEAVLGENAAPVENGNGYTYNWTAPEEGTVTVTMDDADGWQYNVNVIPADEEDYGSYIYGDTHWSDDDPVVASESFPVNEGDKVVVTVNTYDPASWQGPSGTVNWTLSFVAGENGNEGGDIGGEEGGEEEEEVNYGFGDNLVLGTQEYAVDPMYQYTVYAFSPEETGKYTISISDGILGIVSYTDMWVQNTPSADNVNATEAEWDCTSVGQGIYVAVMADTNVATITVEREELEETDEVPWIYYENVVTPEAFVFEGDFDAMLYVETFDEAVDEAVLGEDGFYHLNSATGPILYVCLNDSLLSLADAVNYGQIKEVIADEDGTVIEKTDFNEAFLEYAACMDEETGLYPLTVDLIEMYKRVGAYQGWYGENGFIGGDYDDAWMFACYYNEGESFEGGATTTTTTTVAADVTTTTATSTESPKTGDTTNAMAFVMLAVLAAGAVVVTVASKKATAR